MCGVWTLCLLMPEESDYNEIADGIIAEKIYPRGGPETECSGQTPRGFFLLSSEK